MNNPSKANILGADTMGARSNADEEALGVAGTPSMAKAAFAFSAAVAAVAAPPDEADDDSIKVIWRLF